MTNQGIQALTELLNSRSKWVRDRAIILNKALSTNTNKILQDTDYSYERLDYLEDCGYENSAPRGWQGDSC